MYGISKGTTFNKNQRFQAYFLASTLKSLRNPLYFNRPYHLESNGLITRKNYILKDIFTSACVKVLRERGEQLTIGGTMYYNNYQSTIGLYLGR